MSDHQPTVSAEEAARMRAWHDDHLEVLRGVGEEGRVFDYLGLTLVVPPNVQIIEDTSDLLGRVVLEEVRTGDKVLDMGTGSGVNAILAASKSTDVTAVDLNPFAVEAARANVKRNDVVDRVSVHRSDVFSAIDDRFDLVIFDPPFRWFAPRDWAEAAITDENYRALKEFFAHVREHLNPGGRVLMFFGTTADIGFLEQLMEVHGFTKEVMATRDLVKDDHPVQYRIYRLT